MLVDDPDEAELLARLLTHAGAPAAVVDDEDDLVSTLAAGQAGAVVVGLALGSRSGTQVLEAVRRHWDAAVANTPVVVVAEASRAAERLRAWQAGSDVLLEKPFHVDELVAALQRVSGMAPKKRQAARQQAFEAERRQIAEERRRR